MRALGIDIGTKRVGVAVSDELGVVAQPLETIPVTGTDPVRRIVNIAERIERIVRDNEVSVIVIGMPLSLSGGDRGTSSRQARALGERLGKRLDVEIVYWDERFTTAEAERVLVEGGVRREKRRQVVDKLAATLILQGYLDGK